jgi:NAD(P)-dependent dehydrogenase (short-subunit alcohol dehydrogenase family)
MLLSNDQMCVIQAAIAHLEATRNGNIVFVSSITAYTPIDGIGLYGVTKASLIALSKAMSQSLAHRHIRVNAIAPGNSSNGSSTRPIDCHI